VGKKSLRLAGAHVAFISHDVSTGTVHIRDWVDERPRSGKAPDLRVKGAVEGHDRNRPSLARRETPKPRGAKQAPRARPRPGLAGSVESRWSALSPTRWFV